MSIKFSKTARLCLLFSFGDTCFVICLVCSMEKQVKDMVHKAFWDVFQESISQDPPDYGHAVKLIEDVKQVNALTDQRYLVTYMFYDLQ